LIILVYWFLVDRESLLAPEPISALWWLTWLCVFVLIGMLCLDWDRLSRVQRKTLIFAILLI
jgi:hypothetical protein